MATVKIAYDFQDGSKGELNANVSKGILSDILTAAHTNKRHIVKNHWSRILWAHKGHSHYNPSFINALKMKRIRTITIK